MKLNVLLAKTDALSTKWNGLLKNYIGFFRNSQGSFLGQQNLYYPKEGTIDEPKRRGNLLVQTTVKEKLDYMVRTSKDYIDSLFSQEATNASGTAKAELIVEGESWGTLTSLELLRLKSLIESGDLHELYARLPVRSDSMEWKKTEAEMYSGREIYETPKIDTENKTTEKESYILPDPNIDKTGGAKYTPQIGTKNTTVILGDGSIQNFSGETSQRERAAIMDRLSNLKIAVIQALKQSNDVESIPSEVNSDKIFNYLHLGTTNP